MSVFTFAAALPSWRHKTSSGALVQSGWTIQPLSVCMSLNHTRSIGTPPSPLSGTMAISHLERRRMSRHFACAVLDEIEPLAIRSTTAATAALDGGYAVHPAPNEEPGLLVPRLHPAGTPQSPTISQTVRHMTL